MGSPRRGHRSFPFFLRHGGRLPFFFFLLLSFPGVGGVGREASPIPWPIPIDWTWDPGRFEHRIDVGPGYPFETPSEVPWEGLTGGTLVRIHARPEPYRDKWVIGTVATAQAPLVVLGVPDRTGNLPIVSGEDAVTRSRLDYWNEARSLLKIGGSNAPHSGIPTWIVVEGIEFRRARPPFSFIDARGRRRTYAQNAAALHIETGVRIAIRKCRIHDSANGIFASHGSRDLLVQGNHIFGNGLPGSIYAHGAYTESLGIRYEFNRFSPPCPGCGGNGLKDRSAGTVIRFNTIEGGNRLLDLVESTHPEITGDPTYRETFVYGNILITGGEGEEEIIHYGGDGPRRQAYRAGTLYFYHNTVISRRCGRTTLLLLSSSRASALLFGNVVFLTKGKGRLGIVRGGGEVTLVENWLPAGWRGTFSLFSGSSVRSEGNLTGTDPGFLNPGEGDFHLRPDSPCIDRVTFQPAVLSRYPLTWQYRKEQRGEPRNDPPPCDIGAYAAKGRTKPTSPPPRESSAEGRTE
ncbi:MAG: right-handed parallel beta-helix repeat-containing protein [Deltaproteobacteria bacterium]|nr:MAG: right-handed parallel beta-helix repeat-containing protein [Deltaproteobacteria bacterium]